MNRKLITAAALVTMPIWMLPVSLALVFYYMYIMFYHVLWGVLKDPLGEWMYEMRNKVEH